MNRYKPSAQNARRSIYIYSGRSYFNLWLRNRNIKYMYSTCSLMPSPLLAWKHGSTCRRVGDETRVHVIIIKQLRQRASTFISTTFVSNQAANNNWWKDLIQQIYVCFLEPIWNIHRGYKYSKTYMYTCIMTTCTCTSRIAYLGDVAIGKVSIGGFKHTRICCYTTSTHMYVRYLMYTACVSDLGKYMYVPHVLYTSNEILNNGKIIITGEGSGWNKIKYWDANA